MNDNILYHALATRLGVIECLCILGFLRGRVFHPARPLLLLSGHDPGLMPCRFSRGAAQYFDRQRGHFLGSAVRFIHQDPQRQQQATGKFCTVGPSSATALMMRLSMIFDCFLVGCSLGVICCEYTFNFSFQGRASPARPFCFYRIMMRSNTPSLGHVAAPLPRDRARRNIGTSRWSRMASGTSHMAEPSV